MRVNTRITSLAASLANKDGSLISTSESLQKALNMRVEIAQVFANEFDGVAQSVVGTFVDAAKNANARFVEAGIASQFSEADAGIIQAMMTDTGAEITSASIEAQALIAREMYISTISGGNQADLIEQVTQYLVGQTDKRGKSMLSHVDTIVRTRYMEMDSLVTQIKGEEFGIDKYKYVGGLIRDSRDWCVKHNGKTFTLSEIKLWAGQQWQGKKSGDPFVVRGGWNCIHRFRAVI